MFSSITDFNDTVALDGRQLTRIYKSHPFGIVFNSGKELTFVSDDFFPAFIVPLR